MRTLAGYQIYYNYRDDSNYGTSRIAGGYEETIFLSKEKAQRICDDLNQKWGEYDSYYRRWTYTADLAEFEIDEDE